MLSKCSWSSWVPLDKIADTINEQSYLATLKFRIVAVRGIVAEIEPSFELFFVTFGNCACFGKFLRQLVGFFGGSIAPIDIKGCFRAHGSNVGFQSAARHHCGWRTKVLPIRGSVRIFV
jgi:hypothetical protein